MNPITRILSFLLGFVLLFGVHMHSIQKDEPKNEQTPFIKEKVTSEKIIELKKKLKKRLAEEVLKRRKSQELLKKQVENSLNLALFLDKGDEEALFRFRQKEEMGAVSLTLMEALIGRQNVLASSSLISGISYFEESGGTNLLESIKSDPAWRIFISVDRAYFLFLYNNESHVNKTFKLSKLGFNSLHFSNEIEHSNLDSTIEDIRQRSHEKIIDIESLKNVFSSHVVIPKFIYLIGHGDYYNALIAQMTIEQYNELLEYFSRTGCMFLYVSTCYGGGINLVDANKNLITHLDEYDQKNKFDITFPLIFEGITDSEVYKRSDDLDFEQFFSLIQDFFLKKAQEQSSTLIFSCIAQAVSGASSGLLSNIPQVRLPFTRGYFRPIDADKIATLITYPILLQHELLNKKSLQQKKLIEESGDKSINLSPPFIIKKESKAVFLYPSVLTLPLQLSPDHDLPALISMIPGNAQHYLKELIIPAFDGDRTIKSLVEKLFNSIPGQKENKSNKLFFIKKITFLQDSSLKDDLFFKNVLVFTQPSLSGSSIHLYWEDNKNFKHSTWGNDQWKNFKDIPFTSRRIAPALQKLTKLLTNTVPSEAALFQSSGGHETRFTFCKAVQEILPQCTDILKRQIAGKKAQLLEEALEENNYTEAINVITHQKDLLFMNIYQKEWGNERIAGLFQEENLSLNERFEILNTLFKYGLNFNYHTKGDYPILHYLASWNNETELPAVLMHLYQNFKMIDWNSSDGNGLTCLSEAIEQGNSIMVEQLLTFPEINLTKQDKEGVTPLARARRLLPSYNNQEKMKKIVKLLEEKITENEKSKALDDK